MADVIYEVPLGSAGSINQGYTGQKAVEYRTKAIIVAPLGYTIPPQDWQGNLTQYLQNGAMNDDPEQRLQIITNIQTIEPDNQEATPLEFGFGPSQRIYGDQRATIYTRGDTDLIKHQLLQNLNEVGSDRCYFRWDDKNQIIGTMGPDGLMTGFTASEFFAYNIDGDTGNGVAQRFRIAWADASEGNNGRLIILPTKITPAAITNVMSIHLKVIADLNTRVVTLAFMGGGLNFPMNLAQRDAYRTILVNNPNLVNFTTGAGAPLTISSATAAFINGMHGVTYTLSATGYPATGQQIFVDMDAVSVLNTAFGTPLETPEDLVITVS